VLVDSKGNLRARYGVAQDGAAYLLRPDQHVCARWVTLDEFRLRSAVDAVLARQVISNAPRLQA
jgi:3-(3-hydroxy-phenyl)propionate hydroxylase